VALAIQAAVASAVHGGAGRCAAAFWGPAADRSLAPLRAATAVAAADRGAARAAAPASPPRRDAGRDDDDHHSCEVSVPEAWGAAAPGPADPQRGPPLCIADVVLAAQSLGFRDTAAARAALRRLGVVVVASADGFAGPTSAGIGRRGGAVPAPESLGDDVVSGPSAEASGARFQLGRLWGSGDGSASANGGSAAPLQEAAGACSKPERERLGGAWARAEASMGACLRWAAGLPTVRAAEDAAARLDAARAAAELLLGALRAASDREAPTGPGAAGLSTLGDAARRLSRAVAEQAGLAVLEGGTGLVAVAAAPGLPRRAGRGDTLVMGTPDGSCAAESAATVSARGLRRRGGAGLGAAACLAPRPHEPAAVAASDEEPGRPVAMAAAPALSWARSGPVPDGDDIHGGSGAPTSSRGAAKAAPASASPSASPGKASGDSLADALDAEASSEAPCSSASSSSSSSSAPYSAAGRTVALPLAACPEVVESTTPTVSAVWSAAPLLPSPPLHPLRDDARIRPAPPLLVPRDDDAPAPPFPPPGTVTLRRGAGPGRLVEAEVSLLGCSCCLVVPDVGAGSAGRTVADVAAAVRRAREPGSAAGAEPCTAVLPVPLVVGGASPASLARCRFASLPCPRDPALAVAASAALLLLCAAPALGWHTCPSLAARPRSVPFRTLSASAAAVPVRDTFPVPARTAAQMAERGRDFSASSLERLAAPGRAAARRQADGAASGEFDDGTAGFPNDGGRAAAEAEAGFLSVAAPGVVDKPLLPRLRGPLNRGSAGDAEAAERARALDGGGEWMGAAPAPRRHGDWGGSSAGNGGPDRGAGRAGGSSNRGGGAPGAGAGPGGAGRQAKRGRDGDRQRRPDRESDEDEDQDQDDSGSVGGGDSDGDVTDPPGAATWREGLAAEGLGRCLGLLAGTAEAETPQKSKADAQAAVGEAAAAFAAAVAAGTDPRRRIGWAGSAAGRFRPLEVDFEQWAADASVAGGAGFHGTTLQTYKREAAACASAAAPDSLAAHAGRAAFDPASLPAALGAPLSFCVPGAGVDADFAAELTSSNNRTDPEARLCLALPAAWSGLGDAGGLLGSVVRASAARRPGPGIGAASSSTAADAARLPEVDMLLTHPASKHVRAVAAAGKAASKQRVVWVTRRLGVPRGREGERAGDHAVLDFVAEAAGWTRRPGAGGGGEGAAGRGSVAGASDGGPRSSVRAGDADSDSLSVTSEEDDDAGGSDGGGSDTGGGGRLGASRRGGARWSGARGGAEPAWARDVVRAVTFAAERVEAAETRAAALHAEALVRWGPAPGQRLPFLASLFDLPGPDTGGCAASAPTSSSSSSSSSPPAAAARGGGVPTSGPADLVTRAAAATALAAMAAPDLSGVLDAATFLPPSGAQVGNMLSDLTLQLRRALRTAAGLRTAWEESRRALLGVHTGPTGEPGAGGEFPPASGVVTLGEGRVAAEMAAANRALRARMRNMEQELAALRG